MKKQKTTERVVADDGKDKEPKWKPPAIEITMDVVSPEQLDDKIKKLQEYREAIKPIYGPLFKKAFTSWNERILVGRQQASHAAQYLMQADDIAQVLINMFEELRRGALDATDGNGKKKQCILASQSRSGIS